MKHWFQSKGLLWFIRIGMMSAITGFNFWLAVTRWGWLDSDPRVKVSAVLVAGGTELGLFAFLVLFNQRFYVPNRRWSGLAWWGVAAALAVGISLYVNIGYFSKWKDPDGNAYVDLAIRGVVPMVFLLAFSMIPPKVQKIRTAADVEQEYEGKLAEARLKQQLKEIERQAERREEQERQEKRKQREAVRATQLQMLRLAREAWGQDRVDSFTVPTPAGEYETDWQGLEDQLRAERHWPPTIAQLPSVEELIQAAKEEEEQEQVSDPNMDAVTATGEPKWWTAEYIATRYSLPLAQVRLRMKADYRGKYKKIPSRWIIVAGKKVRKAYYKRVQAIVEDDNVQEDVQAEVEAFVEAGV